MKEFSADSPDGFTAIRNMIWRAISRAVPVSPSSYSRINKSVEIEIAGIHPDKEL
jgi:hypothetical protein